ncbi:hypothetical protein [Mesorhizobium sp. ZC-5]|uniref:hypothetical protein n=1 Tax=Mesorhizobium sp. ZC-5 TaxID=2986066 RepID=UPI0021E7ED86|nr:hypothetical protein [Mesorhizobium sp. ZC-5]MCV3242362.1 hypothetical protein [Mesorhizobium sp. ZC-5]
MIEGATKTTVNVTFNGYTVTENPDGTVTVANQEYGYEVELEAGSLEADLAGLLTQVNPNSSDPQEAREAETVLNTLDGVFASEGIEQEGAGLDLEAVEGLGEVSAATREVIEEHGAGLLAEPVIDQEGEVLDLYGERPQGAGADWVPVDWQGVVRWVHPDVAKALMADSETLATISELSAVIDQSNAQSDVYALDPDHASAQAGAEDTLNKVLNAHGYSIDFKEPEGSLEDAREALTAAQTVLDDATEVRSAYEEASSTLDAAIEANRELDPPIAAPDPNAPQAIAEGSNIHTDAYQQEDYANSRAEHAEVKALFGEYNRLIAEGDLGSIELAITRNEQAGVDTQSPDHQNLLNLRDLAQDRVALGQANANYLRAESDLRSFEAESARMMREMFDEWAEGNSGGGDDMYARVYVTADGQAMIDLYYDRGQYVEEYNIDRPASHHSRYGQSIRLSVFDQDLNPEVSRNPPGSWIDKSLNTAWNEHVATGVPEGKSLNSAWNEHPEGVPEEVDIYTHGQTFIAARENAAADLNELIASNADTALEGLNEGLTAAKSQFVSDLAEHGPGTTELPDDAFPDGVEPVSMKWRGQTIMISPEGKEQLEAGNLDAVIASGIPIQVQIDVTPDDGEYNPESRWVAPELALSTLDLTAINTEIGNIEVFRDQLNGTAAGQRDTAENTENYYMPNLVQDERLENDRQNVLNADFQPQFQSLYQNGFDGSFHAQEGDDLERTIRDSLGLDAENEDHSDIVESVAEGIREFGGDTPEVSKIPIFYVDENGTSQTTLFGVRNDEGETVYVDITGKRYTDIEDFRHNNEQFSDDGQVVYAKDLDMTPGEDGRIEIDAQQARVLSAWESAIDPIVGIGTGIATVLSFTPAAPIAAPIALAGGAYLGTRAVINQNEHISRGGDWDDTQSIMNLASIATTALPLGSSLLRTGGLIRAGIPRGTAFMASIGGMKATSAYADDVGRYMQSGAISNRIAYGINATTLAAAVPLVGVSGYDIVVNGGEMNGLQFANAVLNFGAGVFGAGMGIRGLSVRPGSGQTGGNGQNARHSTSDGLVPDGVIPPPSDTTGRPAITAGDTGRPMVVHEQGPDGVYRPTDKVVFHDADHPVIQGETVVREAAGASQEGTRQHPDGGPTPRSPMTDGDRVSARFVWDSESRTFRQSLPAGSRPIELPAAAERPMLTASPATSRTYVSLQNLRHPDFHTNAEQFGAELYGGTPQVYFPVPADPTGPNPVHGSGGRYVDVAVVDPETGQTLAVEIKAYGRWTSEDGEPTMRTVALTEQIQEQINKDIALRGAVPGYEPRWVFLGAPPSPALQRALDDAGIIANIWHPPISGPASRRGLGNNSNPPLPTRTPTPDNGDNPRTFVVDANGVTTRRVFEADPNGEISLVHPAGDSLHGLDTQHLQTREEAEVVLVYSALEAGDAQTIANHDVDPHDTMQPVGERWGVAVRDIEPETHEVRITQVHENELLFFDPVTRRTFGRSQYDGTPPLQFEDGARVFHRATNREYVYNVERQRFEALQPPADAPLYYNADANVTLVRQPEGSFDLFGRGDNTAGVGIWKPSQRDAVHEAPEGSDWHYDEATNRTYRQNENGELQRLAPENENGLVHYDKTNNVTYLVVPHSGEVGFFGRGDNRVPQDSPSRVQRVRQAISNVLGDNRIGAAGRIKAPIPGDVATGPTISSVGRAVGTKTGLGKPNKSVRGWEFKNAPLSPLTGYFVQEAFQFKASTFQNEIETILAGYPEASPFRGEAVRWQEIGAYADDSSRTVVELSVALELRTGDATRLQSGERDFFGARRGVVRELTHGIPFNKVMSETKVSLPLWARLMILQKLGYDPAAIPEVLVNPQELPPEVAVIALRPGFEDRPEIEIDGLPQGARVSEPFVEQVQAALGQSRIQVQLVTDDPAGLMQALQANPDLTSMHGLHDPEQSLIFVDGSVRSGMRLSRVKVDPDRLHITDLAGRRRNVMNPSQMNLDVVFNRHLTVDHWLNRASWPLKNRLRASGKLPRRMQPQPHYHPGEGFYRAIQHGNPRAARRETVSVTPLSILRTLSGEIRVAHKTRNTPDATPRILGARHAQDLKTVTIMQSHGGETQVQVPNWLADIVNRGRTGHGVVWPKGGTKALTPLLDNWQAHPERSDSVREFRQNTLKTIGGREGSHLSPAQVSAIIDFLSTQG